MTFGLFKCTNEKQHEARVVTLSVTNLTFKVNYIPMILYPRNFLKDMLMIAVTLSKLHGNVTVTCLSFAKYDNCSI